MKSPLLRFLEWFENLPKNHQSKIVSFISITDGSFNELNATQMGSIDELNKEMIDRFVAKIQKTEQSMLKCSTYYKWEGIGLLLSLRSQIDFLLKNPDYYYYLESGYVETMNLENRLSGDVIKKRQLDVLVNHARRNQPGRELELSDILDRWEQYKSDFASDKHIKDYYLSL